MKALHLPGRKFYSASGAMNWPRFVPLFLLMLVISAALAVFMHLLFRWGHYYIFIVPVICALPLAGIGILAVAHGHCRSPFLAAASGCVAGLLLYLGYYYTGMVDQLGLEYAAQVQLLPNYIRWRKEIEITEDIHTPRRDENREPRHNDGRTVLNWFIFGGELVAVLGLSSGAALRRARKPYCEGCKRWLHRELTRFEPDNGPALVEALRNNSAQALAAMFVTPEYPSMPHTSVAVDFCPSLKEAGLRSCSTYLSVKSITANPQGVTFDVFENSKGKMLARSVQLNPDELPALLPRFPMFQALTGHTAASALQQLGVKAGPPREMPASMVELRPVPSGLAGKVLTRRTAIIGNSFVLGALLAMFAGLGLMVWGGTTAFPDNNSAREASPAEKVFGAALLAIGGLTFLGIGASFFVDPTWLGNRYLRNLVRKEFARRPAHLVDPNHPEAMFVEVVPKLNWGKMKLESASDVGFLLLDKARREILFEGDKEYYRIPAAAMTSCEVELYVEGKGTHGATKFYYVVLRANHSGGFWEAPIRKRGGTGMFLAKKRKRWAEKLCRDILETCGNRA